MLNVDGRVLEQPAGLQQQAAEVTYFEKSDYSS